MSRSLGFQWSLTLSSSLRKATFVDFQNHQVMVEFLDGQKPAQANLPLEQFPWQHFLQWLVQQWQVSHRPHHRFILARRIPLELTQELLRIPTDDQARKALQAMHQAGYFRQGDISHD